MQWFRMYAEFLTDPLIRLLSFEDQRHFVAALCMKASGVLDKEYASETTRREVIASLVGLNDEPTATGGKSALEEANRRLRNRGLVDESWQPINWNKRQFESDSSADRVRKWRERHSNVSVTLPLRTRTDTEQIQKQNREEGLIGAPMGLNREAFEKYSGYRDSLGKPLAPASLLAAQRKLAAFGDKQSEVVEQTMANGWVGLFHVKPNGKPKRTWRPGPEDSGPC
jgi:hypothetical protein